MRLKNPSINVWKGLIHSGSCNEPFEIVLSHEYKTKPFSKDFKIQVVKSFCFCCRCIENVAIFSELQHNMIRRYITIWYVDTSQKNKSDFTRRKYVKFSRLQLGRLSFINSPSVKPLCAIVTTDPSIFIMFNIFFKLSTLRALWFFIFRLETHRNRMVNMAWWFLFRMHHIWNGTQFW